MYFQLSSTLTDKFIEELRKFFSYHPKYRSIVENIQGQNSYEGRPSQGIIIRPSGSNHMSLDPSHFKGTILSHVCQSYVTEVTGKQYPGLSCEWLREDENAIVRNRGTFPSLPGTYFCTITKSMQSHHELVVDPMLSIESEPLTFTGLVATLAHPPIPGAVFLTESPSKFQFNEGEDFTLTLDDEGNPTGEITLALPLAEGCSVSARYHYAVDQLGPFQIMERRAYNQIVRGAIIAFGDRVEEGDRFAVTVEPRRIETALEYGGRWQTNIEIEVFAKDVMTARELADWTAQYFLILSRYRFDNEGIHINNISMGGESSEPFDDTADDYYYTSSLNLECETEWSSIVPLDIYLRSVSAIAPTVFPMRMTQAELNAYETEVKIDPVGVYTTNFSFSRIGDVERLG